MREAGFGRRAVDGAGARDLVRRLRRVWLYTRKAEAEELAAVRVGGRVACISAARRAGLWVPDAPGAHVAVPPNASRLESSGLILHWSIGPAPESSRTVVESLVNMLFHVAGCQPRAEALSVWESALNRGLTTVEVLRAVTWRSASARALVDAAVILSDSGLETFVVHRLRPLGLRMTQQAVLDGRPVDLLIGERLVVQIDGKHHLDPVQRRRDIAGDARLVLRGYTVLRFDYAQILFAWPTVLDAIVTAVAQGRHRPA